MNTRTLRSQRTVILKDYMQKYEWLAATGASYRHLEKYIQSGDIALHLIDGKVQIETLEALKVLSKLPRYADQFAELIVQFEQAPSKVDLFA